MSTDSVVRARIDSDTKARATAALDAMGLSASDAIRLLMLRIADEQRLPFSVQVPNAKTVKAMEAGQGKHFSNEQDLFDDLGL
jgi:DNA-damage-inducible protein J